LGRDNRNNLTWSLSYDWDNDNKILVAIFYKLLDNETYFPISSYRINIALANVEPPTVPTCAFNAYENEFYFSLEYPLPYLFTVDLNVGEIKNFVQFPKVGGSFPNFNTSILISLAFSPNLYQLFAITATGGGLVPEGLFSVDPTTGANRTLLNGSLSVTWYQMNSFDIMTDQWFQVDLQGQHSYQLLDMRNVKSIANGALGQNKIIIGVTWAPDMNQLTSENCPSRKFHQIINNKESNRIQNLRTWQDSQPNKFKKE